MSGTGENMVRVILIRHGRTAGNLEKRYVGRRSDEPLLDGERERLLSLFSLRRSGGEGATGGVPELSQLFGRAAAVWVSPMRRCAETAEILFPGKPQIVAAGLAECDFGDFEYRNYTELNGNPAYQRFLDSGGTDGFPGGERIGDFKRRCAESFREAVEGALRETAEETSRGTAARALHGGDGGALRESTGRLLPFVIHGGTIMAIMEAFGQPKQAYYSWQLKNGEAVMARVGRGADGGLLLLEPLRLGGSCKKGSKLYGAQSKSNGSRGDIHEKKRE